MLLYGSIDVDCFMAVVEPTSTLDTTEVRGCKRACRAFGSMATAAGAAAAGSFDREILDEVIY